VTPLPNPSLSSLQRFETLVFAGGGNRCWWQAGLISELQARGWFLPRLLVGTSAGAAVAAASLTQTLDKAFAECQRLYRGNRRLWEWPRLARLELAFAHQRIYPDWLRGFITDEAMAHLKQSGRDLLVAVTRPAPWLGLRASVLAGSVAYLLDKKVAHSIHPRLPAWLGLRQAFLSLQASAHAAAACDLLAAAGAAPPFMKARRLLGQWALDGGYVDNAPVPQQSPEERASTLVLLTRHYPRLPGFFQWRGRSYWQPSQKVPVSTWDCRAGTTIEQAFELGRSDAQRLLAAPAVKPWSKP